MTTHSVVVVGESLVDVIDRDGSRRETPGGSPLNVAVGLARLGFTPYFISELGDDDDGAILRRYLGAAGVPSLGLVGTDRTSRATATIDASGSADYRFDIRWQLSRVEAPPSAVLHTGSIGAWLEPGAEWVRHLLSSRATSTLGSLDLNIRPSLIADREVLMSRIDDLVASVDVAKLSDEDAAWLYPDLDADGVLDRLLAGGAGLVVLTCGADGSRLATARHRIDVAAPSVSVVDTIGAGDSYMAGLLAAILASDRLETARTGELAVEDLTAVGSFAARCAAVTVGRQGADPPTTAEVGGLPEEPRA